MSLEILTGHYLIVIKKEIKVNPDNISNVIPRNSLCKVIFNLDRIWYFNDRFGIICKLKQMKLEETPQSLPVPSKKIVDDQNYLFLD